MTTACSLAIALGLISIVFTNCNSSSNQNIDKTSESSDIKIVNEQNIELNDLEVTRKKDSSKNIEQKQKILRDTTIVLFFHDLSNVYNFEIIDKFQNEQNLVYYDHISRTINIFDKHNYLIQKIYPKLLMPPWYFPDNEYDLKLSRSYLTGKNADYIDMDNYCGEIVVADLNFDGLDDFATPVSSGADNGPHYAFYIQNDNNKFELNSYLTENVIWFPEKIIDSLMSFTSEIPCTIFGILYQTFKYNPSSGKWNKTANYVIDMRTGKIMK